MADVIFCGLALECAPGRVMTPRPATERLVEVALRELGPGPARVVDVGTGSGAVALAEENVRRHGLEERVQVRRGDLLEPLDGSFDLIVANLPYLPAASAAVHPELAGEPAGAVYAPGDGLGPYRRLLAAAEERLTARGAVVLQLHRQPVLVPRDELALALAA